MGYSKAFKYSEIRAIKAHISKPIGMLWITGCLLFIATAILLIINKDYWKIVGIISIGISQIVIIINWKDAKFGTIANLIILASIVASFYSDAFNR